MIQNDIKSFYHSINNYESKNYDIMKIVILIIEFQSHHIPKFIFKNINNSITNTYNNYPLYYYSLNKNEEIQEQ